MRHVSFDAEESSLRDLVQQLQGADGVDIYALTVTFAELDDRACRTVVEALRGAWADARAAALDYDPSMPGVRRLDLSSNRIQSFVRAGLIDALDNNRTLTQLELQGNELVRGSSLEDRLDEIRGFARAVGRSALRHLNLTANCFGDAGLAVFFDTLPRTGTSLRDLYLSVNTYESDAGSLAAAQSIARFLQDAEASRGLESLHLNGNHFGWAGVKIIAHAIMGSRRACTLGGALESDAPKDMLHARPPNTSLLHIDLFSTGIDSWNATPAPGLGDAWEAYSAVTPDNWLALVSQQLEANAARQSKTRRAASQMLAAARIATCAVQDAAPPMPGTFSWRRLPAELQDVILQSLDDAGALTREQQHHVLQWARERSTLGYGGPPGTPIQQRVEASSDTSEEPWSWDECFLKRSYPRNWYSEWVDAHEGHETQTVPPSSQLAFWEATGTNFARP